MTRGRRGSLRLRRMTLSFTAPRRCDRRTVDPLSFFNPCRHLSVTRAVAEGRRPRDGVRGDAPMRAWFLVRKDGGHGLEPTFNEAYAKEPVPTLAGVPGLRRAGRHRQPSPTEPRYLAAYELGSAAVR